MSNKYDFYVNEPLGVVVAKMTREDFFKAVFDTAMRKLLMKYKNTRLGNVDNWNYSLSDYVYSYFIRWSRARNTEKSIVARARCNFEDGDVFDEKIGIYIACDRMDMKIAKTAHDFLYDFINDMTSFINDVIDNEENVFEFYMKTSNHVEDLTSLKD